MRNLFLPIRMLVLRKMKPTPSLLAEAELQKIARVDLAQKALDAARAASVLDFWLHFDAEHPLFRRAQCAALILHRWRNPKHPDNYAHAHQSIAFERCPHGTWRDGWRVHVGYRNDTYSGGSCGYEFDVTQDRFFEAWREAEGGGS